MNTGRPERRFHLPEALPRPDGLAPETARLLEVAVLQGLADAVRTAGGGTVGTGSEPDPQAARGGGRDDGRGEGTGDGYEVPSYARAGRPVTLPLFREAGGGAATGSAGGLGVRSGAGTGGRNLGGGGRNPGGGARTAPEPRSVPREPSWTPERLAALRTRMGHAYRQALLGRISADSLVVGSTGVRLVPALGGTDGERTVGARLGAGAFYLEPIARERVGLVAAAVPGAGFAVHRVTGDGRRHDTGLRVIARDAATVPAGVLAYTGDFTTLREVTVVGHRTGDPRAAAALIAAALEHGLAGAPGSVVAATLKDHLKGLDDDELMACFGELRRLGKLGETFALVRSRGFRDYLHERRVPWTYVLAHWEPHATDMAAVFGGVLWGGGEYHTQIIEVVYELAGSPSERERFWTGLVTLVQHPLVTAEAGLRQLRDVLLEKLEQLEFFDAGRLIGQLVVTLLTLPSAVRALPRLGGGAVRAVLAVDRVGVAALDGIGLRLVDVVRFLLSERPSTVTPEGVLLSLGGGDDILAAGTRARGTSAVSRAEVVQALREEERLFTAAEVEELVRALDEAEQRAPRSSPAGAGGVGAAALSVEVLEELVAQAIVDVGALPGSAGLSPATRGTKLHAAFARLVRARFPGSGLTVVSETSLRAFAELPAEILDLPIETYVKRTPGVAELERQLRPLFAEDGVPRLIGDLKPDLVVRAPGRLVVFDLASVERVPHMAKNMLYTVVLREAGEAALVGETYWRHFGATAAEMAGLYRSEFRRAARIQREVAARLERLRAAKGAAGP